MFEIVTVPNTVLTSQTKKVEKFDGQLNRMVKDMEVALAKQVNPQVVGLAAPQVGVDLAVFIIRPSESGKIEAFVNTEILKIETHNPQGLKKSEPANPEGLKKRKFEESRKKRKHVKLEGCLSIPKIWGTVDRAGKVLLKYRDINGKQKQKWFSGFKAIIIQHEVDHLNGILFTQRVLEQGKKLNEEEDGELEKITS